MEKNFEKLSIEEMSLVSGGELFNVNPSGWAVAVGVLTGGAGVFILRVKRYYKYSS